MNNNRSIIGAIIFTVLLSLSGCNSQTGNGGSGNGNPGNGELSDLVGAGGVCGTIVGLVCEDDLFCKTPTGECNIADGDGICTATPKACPDIYAPVCGCDGVTYGNKCEAEAASMSIEHTGECAVADPVLESKDWSAWENHQPPGPVTFHVKGTVVVRATNYTAKLERAAPQGINPNILLLNLVVTESGPIGGSNITNLDVQYSEAAYAAGAYSQVTILRDGAGGTHIPQVDIVQ